MDSFGDEELNNICSSLSQHFDTLVGVHLNLNNSKVSDQGIQHLTRTISKIKNLRSFGLDIGHLKIDEMELESLTSTLASKDNLISLALGFHSTQITNKFASTALDFVGSKTSTLKMLRLNFSNTKIDANTIQQIASVVKHSSLINLELFIGGTPEFDDTLLEVVVESVKSLPLQGFEIDIGYSKCTDAGVSKLNFEATNLCRCTVYMNG